MTPPWSLSNAGITDFKCETQVVTFIDAGSRRCFGFPLPDEDTVSCRVCGAANSADARLCKACGVTLRKAESTAHVDSLLQDLLDPTAEPSVRSESTKGATEPLDIDAEIVDELLDSLLIEDRAPPIKVECPLCGNEVAADATRCGQCGSQFEEVVLEPGGRAGEGPRARTEAAHPRPRTSPAAHEDIPISAAVTESEGWRGAFSARLIDIVVMGTVAGLAGIFFLFRLYTWTALAIDPLPTFLFVAVASSGMALGLVLFRLSTSFIAHGDRLVKAGRYREALAYFDRAIRMGHRPSNAWTSRGVAMKRLGELEEALRCQQMAVRLDSGNEIAWCNQGDLHFRMGEFPKALECYDKAIEIRPRYAIAWNNKGAAFARMSRFEEARACHDRAIRLQPRYVAAWLNRGEILARLGERNEAQRCLERARALGA